MLLGNLPPVTSIRYLAPAEVASRLTRDSFRATVDLSGAQPQAGNPVVIAKVDVTAAIRG